MRGWPTVEAITGEFAANWSRVENVSDSWKVMALLSQLRTIWAPNLIDWRPFTQLIVSCQVKELLATGRSNKVGPIGAMPAKVPMIGLASRSGVPAAAAYQTPRLKAKPASLSKVGMMVLV